MNDKTKNITGIGMLTAVVIVLQVLAVMLRPTGLFSISLVLVPIVVGAALYGPKAGAWLGLVFGCVVLLNDSAAFMAISIPGTVATVLVKGVCCGLVAGCVYKLIESKNTFLAVLAAAIVCPIVNTGIFVIGCRLFFFDTITAWATEAGAASAGAYIIFTLIGINFLIEMAVNIVLSSVIVRIIGIGKKA